MPSSISTIVPAHLVEHRFIGVSNQGRVEDACRIDENIDPSEGGEHV
ncbi:MAG: hypothetical protein ACR2PG_15335 [Hyphomicrobiaceae bacterium]